MNLPVQVTQEELSEILLTVAPVRPVFIWGAPGIGKSALVEQFAMDVGMECVSLLGSQLAPEDIIGIPASDAPCISAKMGINIEEVLERIVQDIPSPKGDALAPLRALIFDSYYDSYKGVIVYIRIMDGTISVGDIVKMMHTGAEFEVVETGTLNAFSMEKREALYAGEVGYFTASIKNIGIR